MSRSRAAASVSNPWARIQPTLKYPLHAQGLTAKGAPPDTDPYIECVLSPGDVLFIPRGHWHYAVAETPSVHLTVGPAARSSAEFLAWIARQLMHNEEFFRKDFPVAAASALGGPVDDAALDAHLEEFRRRVIEVMAGDALREAVISYVMESNPVKRLRQLPQAFLLEDRIAPETTFQIPAAQKTIIRYDPDTRAAAIHVRGHLLQLTDLPESLVMPLFGQTGVPLTGEALMQACPEIGWDKLRETLFNLHASGMLELSDVDATVAP